MIINDGDNEIMQIITILMSLAIDNSIDDDDDNNNSEDSCDNDDNDNDTFDNSIIEIIIWICGISLWLR